MPRYFFNVYDGRSALDREGAALPDIHHARREAIQRSGRILDDEAHRIALGEEWRMEVCDGTGLILFRLDFSLTAAPALGGGTVA